MFLAYLSTGLVWCFVSTGLVWCYVYLFLQTSSSVGFPGGTRFFLCWFVNVISQKNECFCCFYSMCIFFSFFRFCYVPSRTGLTPRWFLSAFFIVWPYLRVCPCCSHSTIYGRRCLVISSPKSDYMIMLCFLRHFVLA